MRDVILSAAISVDGFLDDATPRRLLLSSPEDWAAVRRLRAKCHAILVGAETVRRDNPSLMIRDPELREKRMKAGLTPDIVKVTLTRSGVLDPQARFFTEGAGRKIVFSTQPLPQLNGLAEVVIAKWLTASFIADWLAADGLVQLMVEGGAQVLEMFMSEGVANRMRLSVAPFAVGSGTRFVLPTLPRMTLRSTEQLGDTTVMHLEVMRDKDFLRRAFELSRQSAPVQGSYRVGAVIVTPAGQLFEGYTHETDDTNHAEEEAIIKALAAGANLSGSTIYASMEPCSTRASKPVSCSELIIRHGFEKVVFALAEPPVFVTCTGMQNLRESGVRVAQIEELANEVREINKHLLPK